MSDKTYNDWEENREPLGFDLPFRDIKDALNAIADNIDIKIKESFDAGYQAALSETPKYETPEDFKQRTGKEYPDDAPVFAKMFKNEFCKYSLMYYYEAKHGRNVIIANENGKPPADYKPEGIV